MAALTIFYAVGADAHIRPRAIIDRPYTPAEFHMPPEFQRA